jgi:hypothetical protein
MEQRLRAAAEAVGAPLTLGAPPGELYLSPTRPTLVATCGGRVVVHAVGELPFREIRTLLASLLRAERDHHEPDPPRPP